MSRTLLVTGATGKQGGSVIAALLANQADFNILALTRDVSSPSAKKLAARSTKITLLEGNLDDTDDVFKNASKVATSPIWGVFSVQSPAMNKTGPIIEEKQGKDLVDAALKNNVKHFVYSSVDRNGLKSIENPTDIPHFMSKHNVELHLLRRTTGTDMGWTILRPVAFMENFDGGLVGKIFASCWKLVVKSRPLQLIATADIGAFAAKAFIDTNKFVGKSISLAGDELTYDQMAAVFKEKTGSEVPLAAGILARMTLWLSKEMGTMFAFFEREGYGADVKELRCMHPELKTLALLEARVDRSHSQAGYASGQKTSPHVGDESLPPLPETCLTPGGRSPRPLGSLQDDSTRGDALTSNEAAATDDIAGDPPVTSEMMKLYFEKMDHATPMIHRSRYETCVESSSANQPPMCLQYIICATGASHGSTCQPLAMPLYRQARAYAEADEMDDEGQRSFDLAHVQAWLLIANFEARKGLFSRAAVSLARSIRMAQMLNLHRERRNDETETLPPRGFGSSHDWIVLEECRRTWWCLYVSDRLLFTTSGLPSVIDSTQVQASLPASDQAFQSGCPEEAKTLQRVLHDQDRICSLLALRVLAASLFHRAVYLSGSRKAEDGDNTNDEAYWGIHKAIENELISLQSAIPESFRLPHGLKCQQSVFIHVLIQMTMLSLYKPTIKSAQGGNGRNSSYIASPSCKHVGNAVLHIVNIFKSMEDINMALQNPIQSYAAHTVALVLLSNSDIGQDEASKVASAKFLQRSLRQAGKTQPIALSLSEQLELKLAERDDLN
ncbi:Citrinin biosynthesis transcriptional activator ctnR [Fusarium oxysporum f. sp. rapae]|uniref:Citrinin biosynthesis transcriptional activator ctnR n=1 Tax=Fusarium oxysporum f. sp. rapae TaxID=485398 RepID=A0A8J5NK42_FUSOX|nr:Citrinin biosynthesis transcriptional activator ctnR [Fusarium oxysporum f. sp. rapae]